MTVRASKISREEFLFYLRLGFSVIPIACRTKRAALAWKDFTKRFATNEEIAFWASLGYGVGLVMGRISGHIGIDADSKDAARGLCERLPKTDRITVTHNGGHLLYRCPKQEIRPAVKTIVKGIQCDIRAEDSYLVAAPSVHPNGTPYRRHGTWADAPEFDPRWIEQPLPSLERKEISDVRTYLSKIVAVAGQQGHSATYRAACILRDAGLTETEALATLIDWNQTNALPRWSTGELLHKVKSVYSKRKK